MSDLLLRGNVLSRLHELRDEPISDGARIQLAHHLTDPDWLTRLS